MTMDDLKNRLKESWRKDAGGHELLQSVGEDGGIPDKGGQKDYAPDGSWLDAKRLESFYRERKETLCRERIHSIGSMVKADWISEESRVLLTKNGKFSKTMGYVEDGKHYLLPEEALFLMDEGSIWVHYKGVALSVQEGYSVILNKDVSLDQYQVFSYFTRLGYTLRRYSGPSNVTNYEKKLNLDQYSGKANRKMKRKDRQQRDEPGAISPTKRVKTDALQANDAPAGPSGETSNKTQKQENSICNSSSFSNESETSRHLHEFHRKKSDKDVNSDGVDVNTSTLNSCDILMNDLDSEPNTINSCDNTTTVNDQQPLSNIIMPEISSTEKYIQCMTNKFTHWNFDEIDFPDISNHTHIFKFKSKSEHLLPSSIKPTKQEHRLDLVRHNRNMEDQLDFSQGLAGIKSRLRAKNWTEYKQKLAEVTSQDCLMTSPVGYLWEDDDVTPLIQPKDACDTASMLEKLKVIENINVSSHITREDKVTIATPAGDTSAPRIVYDGYRPNTNFVKSNPGTPQFRLVLASADSGVAGLGSVGRLAAQSETDGVPLIWAVVQAADISFFSFNGIDLPRDVFMG